MTCVPLTSGFLILLTSVPLLEKQVWFTWWSSLSRSSVTRQSYSLLFLTKLIFSRSKLKNASTHLTYLPFFSSSKKFPIWSNPNSFVSINLDRDDFHTVSPITLSRAKMKFSRAILIFSLSNQVSLASFTQFLMLRKYFCLRALALAILVRGSIRVVPSILYLDPTSDSFNLFPYFFYYNSFLWVFFFFQLYFPQFSHLNFWPCS